MSTNIESTTANSTLTIAIEALSKTITTCQVWQSRLQPGAKFANLGFLAAAESEFADVPTNYDLAKIILAKAKESNTMIKLSFVFDNKPLDCVLLSVQPTFLVVSVAEVLPVHNVKPSLVGRLTKAAEVGSVEAPVKKSLAF